MLRHFNYECGTPLRFECPYCKYRCMQRDKVWRHILPTHPNQEIYCIDIVTNTKLYKNRTKRIYLKKNKNFFM